MRPPPGAYREPDIVPVLRSHLETVLERVPSTEELCAVAEAFRDCSRTRLELVPGALEALTALRTRWGVGLISNAQWVFTRPELARFGLEALLDPVVISSEVGLRKPARGSFEAALARAGVRAAAALHVGNDPVDDVDGALHAGLWACRVHDTTRPGPGLHPPDLEAPTVAEVPALLATWVPRARKVPALEGME